MATIDQPSKCYGTQRGSGKMLKVTLNEKEARLCQLLDDLSQTYRQEHPDQKPLTLRIAGGWVRDKLLGLESSDIDVAVDIMTGYELAQLVRHGLQKVGHKTSQVAKINSNPERSKHLETATMMVLDMSIDFVNLRSEVYDPQSRIPSAVQFGTPTEDAYRRDITINALFYNIHTREVEDFTSRGIPDLVEGIVRTPLAAYETFQDDPLRILRCIRFASRFRFAMDPDIPLAVQKPEILSALREKISRERIGSEVNKMIKHENASLALRYITRLALHPYIFSLPSSVTEKIIDMTSVDRVTVQLDWLFTDTHRALIFSGPHEYLSDELADQRRLLYLSACLYPLRDIVIPHGKRSFSGPQYVVRESLKLSNQDMDFAHRLIAAYEPWQRIVKAIASPSSAAMDSTQIPLPVQVGLLIRTLGQLWPTALLFAFCEQASRDVLNVREHNEPGLEEPKLSDMINETACRELAESYHQTVEFIVDHELAKCHTWKHVLTGRPLAKKLKVPPGPNVGQVLELVMEWQLLHPQGTAAECETYLRACPKVAAITNSNPGASSGGEMNNKSKRRKSE
ncbi:CCA tRNA nucleotidyltransferase, mitochondrial [Dispira parvispora]|uniref:CCA tRNA nucleotidyltransferase, mitochondrial n=1 Tax=Dispira parvispora TaxID=1520584 RepID=A0A9W8AR23_9FUNG|nr:CCA tRNA nucleotidyltransferase, mitochondrial [Dispira parvispora]